MRNGARLAGAVPALRKWNERPFDWSFFVLSPAYRRSAGGFKSSFRRAGSIAILTASSNRSNSTSVIALSEFESAGILTVRIAIVPQITDAHCAL